MALADDYKWHFGEGVSAREDRLPITSCPYAPPTRDGNAWREGWRTQDRMIAAGIYREKEAT